MAGPYHDVAGSRGEEDREAGGWSGAGGHPGGRAGAWAPNDERHHRLRAMVPFFFDIGTAGFEPATP